MNDIFVLLLLGHLTGDYLLQNNWMAMNKSGSTWKCSVHCWIYATTVCVFTWPMLFKTGWWWLFIYATHFPIDRWGWADKWLKLIGGRSISEFIWSGHQNIPAEAGWNAEQRTNYHMMRAGFTAAVYCAADNTLHLLLMYFGYRLLFA